MKNVAYVNPFVPAEWIAAHGLRPLKLRPRAVDGRFSAGVARGFCPYAAALIETVAAGIDAAALILTTTCDPMRYAAALLEMRTECPVFLLNVPSTRRGDAPRALYRSELRRLGVFLTTLGGQSPDPADLRQTILGYHAQQPTPAKLRTGIPLAVLGGPMMENARTFFDLIERAGGRVALNAVEGSERTMPRPFDPERLAIDPLGELADAYFDGIEDPFRRPNDSFYDWLRGQLVERHVRGIICRRYLWCDLWHGELPRLRECGLPVLEVDIGPDDAASSNRIEGRIEAFLEMLN